MESDEREREPDERKSESDVDAGARSCLSVLQDTLNLVIES